MDENVVKVSWIYLRSVLFYKKQCDFFSTRAFSHSNSSKTTIMKKLCKSKFLSYCISAMRKNPLQITSDHFRMTTLSFDEFFNLHSYLILDFVTKSDEQLTDWTFYLFLSPFMGSFPPFLRNQKKLQVKILLSRNTLKVPLLVWIYK